MQLQGRGAWADAKLVAPQRLSVVAAGDRWRPAPLVEGGWMRAPNHGMLGGRGDRLVDHLLLEL
jgi:hypothetical protein